MTNKGMIEDLEQLVQCQKKIHNYLMNEYDKEIKSKNESVERANKIGDMLRDTQYSVYISNHILGKLKDLKELIKEF